MQQLKVGSSLQGGKYKIEKVLGQGGFGITYLATQELLDRKVCIKEFFFKEYCERDEATSHVTLGTQSNHELVERFMTKFLKEARTISQLEHPHIIRIHDIFKENNTAYYVMEYIEGESLNDIVNQSGALPESESVEYIKQVASALNFIHQQSINHLDVKPANIMIRKSDNKAILIDFGLSKQYDEQGGQTSTTPVGISHGYAPMEQYKQGGVSTFSPQTDIYALGATLYKLVTGNTPPQAMDILDEGLPSLPNSISSSVIEAIKKAMQPRKVDRQNSIDEFVNGLTVLSQNTLFVPQEKTLQKNHNNDEETKILNKINDTTEIEKKQKQIIETQQPKIILESDDKDNKREKKNGNKVGYVLLMILGCFVLFFVFKNYNEDDSKGIDVPSSVKVYDQALSYLKNSEYDKAIPLLEEAAKDSVALAWYDLGWCYSNGKGVVKDIEKAKECFLYAGNKGIIDAFDNLGLLCYEQKEYYVAFSFWKEGAEKEHANSQFNLGVCYNSEIGTTKNVGEAFNWWKKAAEQGHARAQLVIGDCYYNGLGTSKNKEQTLYWWNKSAEQGYADAQYQLGYCYQYGTINEQDSQKAKQWLLLASEQGHEGAKKLLNEIENAANVAQPSNSKTEDNKIVNGKKKFYDGTYVGELLNEKPHGEGTYNYSDGSVYTGSWSNGKRSGWGEYKWFDGTIYKGYWKNNKFHGLGTLYEANGEIRDLGEWENGLLKIDKKPKSQSKQVMNNSKRQNGSNTTSNKTRTQTQQNGRITISGYVGDINGPVIGASVIEKGTNNGTITDIDGRFTLTVNSNAMIRVEFVGYKSREGNAQKNMSFYLEEK